MLKILFGQPLEDKMVHGHYIIGNKFSGKV